MIVRGPELLHEPRGPAPRGAWSRSASAEAGLWLVWTCRCPRRWWSGGVGAVASVVRGVGAGVRGVGVPVPGHVEGAVVVVQVLVAVGAGPHVAAAFQGGVGPAAVGLGPVMAPTERGGVARAAVLDLGVGDPVVAVGVVLVGLQGAGGSGAPGEHAGRASSR